MFIGICPKCGCTAFIPYYGKRIRKLYGGGNASEIFGHYAYFKDVGLECTDCKYQIPTHSVFIEYAD